MTEFRTYSLGVVGGMLVAGGLASLYLPTRDLSGALLDALWIVAGLGLILTNGPKS